MINYVFTAIVVLLNGFLGTVVLVRNPRKLLNVSFFLMSSSLAIWSAVSFFEDEVLSVELAKLLVHVDFIFALLMSFFFLVFCTQFLHTIKKGKALITVSTVILVFVSLLSTTDMVISGVQKVKGSGLEYSTGPMFLSYALAVIFFCVAGVCVIGYKFARSRGQLRQQALYVISGLTISIFLAVLTNLILPRFLVITPVVTRIGIYGFLFFTGLTTYSIARHKLMDIRLVAARSVAYIILLVLLAGIYAGSVLGLERIFFPEYSANFNFGQGALRTVVSIVMVFLFQPLKTWITKVTDKIFFKNSYNKDDLLSELSHTLGSTIVLIEMLYKVSDILTQQMKASRTLFALVKDENRLYTVQANGYTQTPEVDPLDVLHITKDGLMVADELPDNSAHKRLLRQYDAAIAIPLKTDKEVVGVLLLGEKSSGDMYSQQDLNVLEIIAPEIAIAIENAKSYEEINRFNVTLRQEVKRATYRLKEKNTQLMELDKAKDEFISMASHQLRTPLTAIKGYLSMLLEGDAGDIKVSQYDFINEAYSGANRMVGLINDLLNVSRMETGRFFLEPKELDIERVVEEEVKQLSNAAITKGLYLKIERKGRVPHIWADETKIRQVVMNFMDNAIYYTNTGGVTVVLSHDKENFIYEVKDTGIGVPVAQKEHMFEKFFRADNARTVRPDGTGLGIYLAKRVIVDHGGEIIFDSVEGKGSVFGFRFPLKKKVEAKPASAPEPRPVVPTPKMPLATEVAEKNTSE